MSFPSLEDFIDIVFFCREFDLLGSCIGTQRISEQELERL